MANTAYIRTGTANVKQIPYIYVGGVWVPYIATVHAGNGGSPVIGYEAPVQTGNNLHITEVIGATLTGTKLEVK